MCFYSPWILPLVTVKTFVSTLPGIFSIVTVRTFVPTHPGHTFYGYSKDMYIYSPWILPMITVRTFVSLRFMSIQVMFHLRVCVARIRTLDAQVLGRSLWVVAVKFVDR